MVHHGARRVVHHGARRVVHPGARRVVHLLVVHYCARHVVRSCGNHGARLVVHLGGNHDDLRVDPHGGLHDGPRVGRRGDLHGTPHVIHRAASAALRQTRLEGPRSAPPNEVRVSAQKPVPQLGRPSYAFAWWHEGRSLWLPIRSEPAVNFRIRILRPLSPCVHAAFWARALVSRRAYCAGEKRKKRVVILLRLPDASRCGVLKSARGGKLKRDARGIIHGALGLPWRRAEAIYDTNVHRKPRTRSLRIFALHGGCSSVGRAPDCDSGCRGFKPRHSPTSPQTLR